MPGALKLPYYLAPFVVVILISQREFSLEVTIEKQTSNGDETWYILLCCFPRTWSVSSDLCQHSGFICLYNKGDYSSLTSQFELVLRDTRPEKKDSRDTVTQLLPHPTTRRFFISPPTRTFRLHHYVNKLIWRFILFTPTQTQSDLPSSFPDVNTLVHTHPKVFFLLKTHCTPMVRIIFHLDPDPTWQRPQKISEWYVSMEQEESPPNESHRDPRLFHTNTCWIFGFLDFFQGCTLAREGRISIYWPQQWLPLGVRNCW